MCRRVHLEPGGVLRVGLAVPLLNCMSFSVIDCVWALLKDRVATQLEDSRRIVRNDHSMCCTPFRLGPFVAERWGGKVI